MEVPTESKRSADSSGPGVLGCEHLDMGAGNCNAAPLRDYYELLTADPFLQTLFLFFSRKLFLSWSCASTSTQRICRNFGHREDVRKEMM